MPALPDVDKVVKIDCVHSYGSDTDVLSRFFLRYGGTAPTVDQLNTFCAAIGASWSANLASLANEAQVSLQLVQATDLTSPTASQGENAAAFPGSRAGVDLPADTSAVIGYEIARRYRGGHPRGYWPFGSQPDLQTPQTWTDAFQTAVDEGILGFMNENVTSGWTASGIIDHVNVSYYSGFTVVTSPTTHRARNVPTPRVTPLVDVVGGYEARIRVGSQRRRLGK